MLMTRDGVENVANAHLRSDSDDARIEIHELFFYAEKPQNF
jgi:hypothetical protein